VSRSVDAGTAGQPVPAAPQSRVRLILAFASVYIVWGSTYLAILYAIESIPPYLMAGARFLVSGAILLAWSAWRDRIRPTSRRGHDAVITGVFMLCGGNGAVVWAEQRVPSGIAALVVAVVPLWMVLLEWLRPGGSRPRPVVVLGIVVGLVGLGLLVGPSAVLGADAGAAVDLTGAAVLMAGSLAWAIGSIYNRHGARPDSAVLSTGMQMLGGAVALLLVSLLAGEPGGFALSQVTTQSLGGWLYLVTFGSLIGFTAYIYLLRATTPAKAATYAYVNPVVAVFLGWAFAGESITLRTIVAAAVILGGVAVITISRD
jgi:drug/metabolite transporter (DMT)-like permease